MRTVPSTIAEHARDGSGFIWIVDVFPAGADTWPQFRWGERAVTVAGNAYEGGIIQQIDPIKYSTRIFAGGGIANRDSVNITLIDKTKELHRTIQQLDIEGRDVQVSLALFPLNLVRNSSFESPTSGSNFDYWTETIGNASNTITRETSTIYHGAQAAKLTCNATTGPFVESDTFKVRVGSTLSASFYARGGAAGDVVNVIINAGGLYWNNTTKVWQAGIVSNVFTLTTSFARYSIENIYSAAGTWSAEEIDVVIRFQVPTVGDILYLDAVQVEARMRASSYHGGRYDMAVADLYPVYWGEIRTPKWDRGTIKLSTKSIMNRRHRDIPATTLTQQMDANWQIPPDNLGKPFPMTFGDFLADNLSHGQIFPTRAAAAGLLVNAVAGADNARVYFDKPGIALGAHGAVYHFSADAKRFYREFLNTDAANYSEWTYLNSDSYIESKVDARRLRQGLMRLSAMLFSVDANPDLGDYADFTNPAYLSDGDLSTFASLTMAAVDATGKKLYFRPQKPQEISGFHVIKAYPLAKVDSVLNSGTATRVIRWAAEGINIGGGTEYVDLSTGATFDNIPSGLPYDADEQAHELTLTDAPDSSIWLSPEQDYYLRVLISAGSSPNVTFRLYGVGLRLDLAIDLVDAVICRSILGRPFGDTWGGRKTAASVIYKPGDVIEAILRHELGIVTTDINTTKFDQAATDYGSRGNVAGQVTEVRHSTDVIEEICAATGLVYYVDGAGKEALACLKHGAATKVLRPRDFVDDQIEMEFVSREEIVTDYVLNWGYVPYADMYIGQIYCNRTDSNIGDSAYEAKCANAYAALGNRENRREYDIRWINSEADAQSLLKFLIDWSGSRRRIAKAKGFLDQLDLEFGDRVDLQLEEYLLERNTDTSRPIFVPYEITIRKTASEAGVDISLLEVIAP